MSGGRFNYNDHFLDDIASELDDDIETNDDVEIGEWSDANYKHEGLHASKRTLCFMRRIASDLRKLSDLLHAYDWYVSGDTCEQTFISEAERLYKDNIGGM